MQSNVITGNAQTESESRWGWFLGHFITPEGDPRSTDAVEVKWGIHAAGEGRSQWADPAAVTTLSILISGRFCVHFPEQEVLLTKQGDYVLWLPGIAHSWKAEADSVIVTVRWPSIAVP